MKKVTLFILAVTNLRHRTHPGKVVLSKDMVGTGIPAGDTTLANNTEYPVGSTYTNLTTGKLYTKTAPGTWTVTGAGS